MLKLLLPLLLLSAVAHGQAVAPPPPRPPPALPAPQLPPSPEGPRVGPLPPGPRAPPKLPRSPNTRLLPQTPAQAERPGLWRADGPPRASASDAANVASRLEAAPETPAGITRPAWTQCWSDVQTCILASPSAARAPLAQYQCLRWTYATTCGGARAGRGELGHPGTLRRFGEGAYNAGTFYASTQAERDRLCQGVMTDTFQALHASLYTPCSALWSVELK